MVWLLLSVVMAMSSAPGGCSEADSSVKWQLCYDVSAKTWWMVSTIIMSSMVLICFYFICQIYDFGILILIWNKVGVFFHGKNNNANSLQRIHSSLNKLWILIMNYEGWTCSGLLFGSAIQRVWGLRWSLGAELCVCVRKRAKDRGLVVL